MIILIIVMLLHAHTDTTKGLYFEDILMSV